MNERMTKRDTDGQAMMDCEKCKADWTGKHGKPMADCTALYCRNRLLGRLVEYEDTGLTPAEVHSMSGEWCAMMSVLNSIGSYDRLRELPAADVVPVVRCKDCKHRTEFGNCGHPRQKGVLPSAYPFDFCSYGEPKEDDKCDMVWI